MTDNETLADILSEMRTYFQMKKRNGNHEHRPWHQVLSDWADRAEAAAQRERRECKAKSGNAAAMGEALELAVDYSEYIVDHLPDEFVSEIHAASEILEKCDSALAAPPRNCDIGTPTEQARRFQLFCQQHRDIDAECSTMCPFVDTVDTQHCQAGWAQMPYEEGGAE